MLHRVGWGRFPGSFGSAVWTTLLQAINLKSLFDGAGRG